MCVYSKCVYTQASVCAYEVGALADGRQPHGISSARPDSVATASRADGPGDSTGPSRRRFFQGQSLLSNEEVHNKEKFYKRKSQTLKRRCESNKKESAAFCG